VPPVPPLPSIVPGAVSSVLGPSTARFSEPPEPLSELPESPVTMPWARISSVVSRLPHAASVDSSSAAAVQTANRFQRPPATTASAFT